MALFFFMLFNEYNPNRSLDRICLDLLLPSYFLTAFVRLPTSALPFHLAVARYVFDETPAHLCNNRTQSVKDSNNRFGVKKIHRRVFLRNRKPRMMICKVYIA